MRSISIIRALEPRFTTNLLLPVQNQIEIIKLDCLPATWLIQFDAIVARPFVPFLKQHMPSNHEVGLWFEMNEMQCNPTGVKWRGRPGCEWDHIPLVAFTIGYTEAERIQLADIAMRTLKDVFGTYPKSIAVTRLQPMALRFGALPSLATIRASVTVGAQRSKGRTRSMLPSSGCSGRTRSTIATGATHSQTARQ